MEKDSKSLANNTLKNSSYSFLGYVFPIAFSIVVTPIMVARLGKEAYGIYVLVNTLIILLGLLDLGLSSAYIKLLSQYRALKQEEKIKNLIFSNNSLFLLIGSAGLIFMLIAGLIADRWLPLDDFQSNFFIAVFALAGVTFFINNANMAFVITPRALERFDISTKIDLALLAASNLAMLALLLLRFQLPAIMLVQAVLALIFSFVYRHYCRKILPQARWRFAWVKSEIIACYKFGLKTFISSLAGSSLNYFDRLFIPFYLGPAALTYYSLPGNVTYHIHGVANSLTAVLFPMVSGLKSLNEAEKIKNLYIRSVRLIAVLAWAIAFSIILFSYKILLFWLGLDFAVNSAKVMVILALTHFFVALARPLNAILLGLDKTKFLAVSSIGMAGLNIMLIVILMPAWGISGAAWAYLASVLPIILMFYYVEKKFLHLEKRGADYLKLSGKILLTSIIFCPIVYFLILPVTVNVLILIITGPGSVLLFLGLYKLFGFFEDEDWQVMRNFYQSMLKRLLGGK